MRPRERTVADWIAEGLKTMALHCGCGHFATVTLADLPPTRLGRNARCAKCGRQGAQVMRDMEAHYTEVEANGGFSAQYPGTKDGA
ncbi:hypothetical protein [Methylobacterium sp. R2-1]|uniref:hypothetical protein n=1 Tax=Methylobacterium sp. R2-1 TaxID=2587064 RepID=UPI0016174D4D|nr:hypothetical protein [Methylobacterium sp. R2-1]MBB2963084.1 bacterioferritin-associated ferredoxin [Methylobacterium sp. R2-1]